MCVYRIIITLAVAFALFSLGLAGLHEQAEFRQYLEIPWDVLDGAGGLMSSPSYLAGGSLGQTAAGACSTTAFKVSGGHWAGIDTLPPCGPVYVCGDCNGDGFVNFADALYLKNYYYQTPPGSPSPIGQGDVNLDGNVTFGDALYIKNYYYQTPPGSPPPCEPALRTAPLREERMGR